MSASSVKDAGNTRPRMPVKVPADAATEVPARRARVRATAAARGVPLATIITAVAVVALAYLAGKLAYRLRDVILLIAVAGFIALILNPLVVYVQRRIPRRGWAVAIVTVWAAVVFTGLLLAFGYPLVNGLTHLAHRLPSYVQSAAHGRGWIGHLARRLHLTAWAARNAPKLQSLGTSLARPALSFGKGAASLLATLATITALVLLLLLEGPKMRRGLLGLMSQDRAARYARVAHEINQSVIGYAAGNLLTSLIAGVVIFVALATVGVPFPFLWALWVALVDFLPMIGGALAGIPTVLFAVSHSLTAGIVTAAVFIGYQQLENHVLNPVVMSRTVKINPLLVLLSILIGSSIGAWLGGLFGGASWRRCCPSPVPPPCRSSSGSCGRPPRPADHSTVSPGRLPRRHRREALGCRRTDAPSHWQASGASSTCRRSAPTERPRLSSALRTRYWTVFLCSVSRSAVALKLPLSVRKTRRVSRSVEWWSSSSASDPRVSMTQARTSSTEPDIRASGATSPKRVTGGPAGPAASATACAPRACWWVRRKPGTPAPAAPTANRIPASVPVEEVPADRMGKESLAPSGSQAHAQDSSCGRKIGRASQPAQRATSVVACSSRDRASPPARIPPTQHITPAWCCRSR